MYENRKLTSEQISVLVEERLKRGFPPHSPPHPVRNEVFYLLTAACYEHACHMRTAERRKQTLDLLFENFIAHNLEINAWVVLPNHYHLLTRVTHFDSLSHIFRMVHGATSHQWNLEDGQRGRTVWYRFSDRAIRSERHYYTTLNYIHYNPVKHGWTESPYAWETSSVHWYLEHAGRAWLQDSWMRFPVREYGKGWDDI